MAVQEEAIEFLLTYLSLYTISYKGKPDRCVFVLSKATFFLSVYWTKCPFFPGAKRCRGRFSRSIDLKSVSGILWFDMVVKEGK